jgi:hypothetical protein
MRFGSKVWHICVSELCGPVRGQGVFLERALLKTMYLNLYKREPSTDFDIQNIFKLPSDHLSMYCWFVIPQLAEGRNQRRFTLSTVYHNKKRVKNLASRQ